MSDFLQGGTTVAAFAIAVFFLRYWRDTADRLFAVFSAAFLLFGVSRVALHLLDTDSETRVWVYALRAAAFLAIIFAVVDKNMHGTGEQRDQAPRRRG
jgi:O-antigen/teichoic acid export membrane protein